MAVVAVSKVAHDGYVIEGLQNATPSLDKAQGDIRGQSMYNRVTLSDADGNILGSTKNWTEKYGRMDTRGPKPYYLRDEDGNLFRVETPMYRGSSEWTWTKEDGTVGVKVGIHVTAMVLTRVDPQGVPLPDVATLTTYVPSGSYDNSDFLKAGTVVSIETKGMKRNNYSGSLKTTNPEGEAKTRCFVTGANILTDAGYALVETLKVGDLIWTASHGFQPIKWIGRSVLDAIDLSVNPKLRPVFISKGALGGGLPESDLRVSRQHRMLLSSDLVNSICDEKEVLVAAIKLTDHPKIYVDEDIKTVEYFHILFDDHQIIKADGALTESLYIGEEALKTMTPEAYAEIIALFPEIGDVNYKPLSACTILDGKMRKNLIAKHLEVGVDFV